jgi:hypothetical protein
MRPAVVGYDSSVRAVETCSTYFPITEVPMHLMFQNGSVLKLI